MNIKNQMRYSQSCIIINSRLKSKVEPSLSPVKTGVHLRTLSEAYQYHAAYIYKSKEVQ